METINRLFYIHYTKRFLNKFTFKGKRYLLKCLNSLMPNLKNDIILKTQYNFKLKISPLYDKGIERSIFNKGIYEEGTLWCFKKILKKGDVVFDIGANIGLTAIYAAKRIGINGNVFAFEPMPNTCDILNYNIRLNKLKNITSINVALSDRIGFAEIYDNIHINRGAASLYSEKKENGITIPLDTLNNIIYKYKIDKIDLIKIDIEGSEISMLKGAFNVFNLERKPIICIEFSREVKSENSVDSLYDILKIELNYELFKQLKGKDTPTPLVPIKSKDELPDHDNIYCFQKYHYQNLPDELFKRI